LSALIVSIALLVAACSTGDTPTPLPTATEPSGSAASAPDPWGKPSSGTPDPWTTSSAPTTNAPQPTEVPPAQPPARPAARAAASDLAGTYQCFTVRYGRSPNGMNQTSYVPSALGAFEIDADGAYRSASYPAKGTGRASANDRSVAFEAGPYAGYVGEVGAGESGPHIRFGEKLTELPAPNLRFGDHMCHRKQ
jgi:hypothetical protein